MTNGIINVLKPPGMTSHDVVSFIRKVYALKRVGHAGTLDPAAAGVLPVFLGQATRLIEFQANADKSYRAELTLGYATDTGDDTGEVVHIAQFDMPDYETVIKCFASFLGEIKQVPPMHSAIKVGGKKLYELARAGISIEREARNVTIRDIRLVQITATGLLFDITCSKGTYIRSLCSDIGKALGIPAVMSFLVRTRAGIFSLDSSYCLEEIATLKLSVLQPPDVAVAHLSPIYLTEGDSVAFRNGRHIHHGNRSFIQDTKVRVYNQHNAFIGIGSANDQVITPVKVFHPD